MLQGLKSASFPEKESVKIYGVYRGLRENSPGWCHLSYSLEFANCLRLSFYSNPEWYYIYITKNYIQNCALIRACRKNDFIIPWHDVKSANDKEEEVVKMREKYAAYDGISMPNHFYGIKELCGLGVSEGNEKLVFANLKKNDFILSVRSEIRKIIENYLKTGFCPFCGHKILDHVTNSK